jgi:hypothetical protein
MAQTYKYMHIYVHTNAHVIDVIPGIAMHVCIGISTYENELKMHACISIFSYVCLHFALC